MSLKMKQNNNASQFIRQITRRISLKFHPYKIILFGSYAIGTPNSDSDVDLLVIFSKKGNRAQRYSQVSRELEPMLLPVDLLIRSTQDIQNRLKIGDSFIEEILSKGKILYER